MMCCKSNTSTKVNCNRNEQKQQALAMLVSDLKRAEDYANQEGWISAEDLEKELDEYN